MKSVVVDGWWFGGDSRGFKALPVAGFCFTSVRCPEGRHHVSLA